jgi:MFS family permease
VIKKSQKHPPVGGRGLDCGDILSQRGGQVRATGKNGAAHLWEDVLTTTTDQTTGPAASPQPLSPGYVSYALWMLLIIYTLNFLDRQIVNILAGPIKAEFGLSNTQMGLLTGLAFAFVYTVLGIPIARYADQFKSNRVTIITIALAVWSAFTALCGMAQNFVQLLIARIGVGVGEAGCTPPAHSLIADKVPVEKRASALAFYSMGVPVGSFFAFAFGGWIAQELNWRWAFLLVGLPGIILAVIAFLTIKEPRKLGLIAPPKADAPKMSFGQALKALGGIKSYWYACFAAAVLSFIGYGQIAFFGIFYGEVHKVPLAQIGLALAVVVGIGGTLGTFVGGQIADAAAKKDTRAYFSVPAIAMILGAPFFVAAMLMPATGAPGLSGGLMDPTLWSLALLAIPTFLNSLWYGPVYASVQGVVSPQLRASAVAIMLFIVNMIGLGFGPTLLGMLADGLSNWQLQQLGVLGQEFNKTCLPIFADNRLVAAGAEAARGLAAANPELANACTVARDDGLRWSLLASGLIGLLAVVLFWLGRGSIREDLARAKAAAA